MSAKSSAHIHKSQHTCRRLGLNENPSIADVEPENPKTTHWSHRQVWTLWFIEKLGGCLVHSTTIHNLCLLAIKSKSETWHYILGYVGYLITIPNNVKTRWSTSHAKPSFSLHPWLCKNKVSSRFIIVSARVPEPVGNQFRHGRKPCLKENYGLPTPQDSYATFRQDTMSSLHLHFFFRTCFQE